MDRTTSPLGALLALLALGCSDTNIRQLTPDLVLATEALDSSSVDFGEVGVPYSDSQCFQVINAGRAPLEVGSRVNTRRK